MVIEWNEVSMDGASGTRMTADAKQGLTTVD